MYTGNLNSIQTIYTVFFAIYYGITISRTIDLSLFDTPTMYGGIKRYPKSWLRFGLSFLFINVIPLFYFWRVMICLDRVKNPIDFCFLFIVFIQSIVGFGFYRILVGILLIKRDNLFYFYDYFLYHPVYYPKVHQINYPIDIPIEKFLLSRPRTQRECIAHIVPGVIWVGITAFLLQFYVFFQIPHHFLWRFFRLLEFLLFPIIRAIITIH